MKKWIAEFVGSFALVLLGCGAAVIGGKEAAGVSGLGLLGISLAFGLTVVAMAYAIGPISGCHINPAVTIGVVVAGRMRIAEAIPYIIAQCGGALAGAGVLFAIVSGKADFIGLEDWALGSNGWGEGYMGNYSMQTAFVTEAVLTALFIIVILGATAKAAHSTMAGLAIGISLVLIHMVAIPITGTSVNPARSTGPALLSGGKALEQLWLFWLAPIAGAIIGAVIWKYLLEEKSK